MYEDEIPVGKATDLRGKKFNSLTVLYRVKGPNKKTHWKCQCDCGNTTVVAVDNLTRTNGIKTCGCARGKCWGDLTGQHFGKLTCIKEVDEMCATGKQWLCQCECGNEVIVSRNHLTQGHTQSCGCFQREQTSHSNSASLEAILGNIKNYKFCICSCSSIISS